MLMRTNVNNDVSEESPIILSGSTFCAKEVSTVLKEKYKTTSVYRLYFAAPGTVLIA